MTLVYLDNEGKHDMAKRDKLPRELKDHLQRLERLRLELRRSSGEMGRIWQIASHVNGVLAMWLVLHVLQDGFSESLTWWSLFEALTAGVELRIACFALKRRHG